MEPIQPGSSPIPPPHSQVTPTEGKPGGGRTTMGIIIGCAGCGVLAAVTVAIGGWLLVSFGLNLFTEQVAKALRDNSVVREHLGELKELELDFLASSAESGPDDFVFHATGSEASGTITATCITVDADTEEVTAGTLRLENGETYDLFPDE